ncbi:MAG: sigma-54-dependent Fis family transcriptional regulator [Acidobacteria bacterium]|nr:sigma-54-dependent Fis family transcriptional regulator [Acidobacteriota bacterium]
MVKKKVLIVEDEEMMRSILRRLLEKEGYDVLSADSAEAALVIFSEADVSVTLTDIKMAGMNGLELLDNIKSVDADALVIIMTAFSSVDSAVAALRKGAYDYITKPFVNEELVKTVNNAIAQHSLFRENRALRRELSRHYAFPEMIGSSESLRSVMTLIEKAADTNTTVLIRGESGTGKELAARALHFASSRAEKNFLAVNCGALPESLLESELFGHKRGSFTGAVADKTGLFRSAEGGTIFLDEIGEMSLNLQVKLLRALQEREVTPIGATIPERFDARIIAATNRDLEAEIGHGRFREDLYYRLNVIDLELPPLRERRGDIPLLVRHFIGRTARLHDRPVKEIDETALHILSAYDWPGNIRELQNVIERAFILGDSAILSADLPAKMTSRSDARTFTAGSDVPPTLDDVERKYVMDVMRSVENDKAKAAGILGIDLSTLYRKLKRFEEN